MHIQRFAPLHQDDQFMLAPSLSEDPEKRKETKFPHSKASSSSCVFMPLSSSLHISNTTFSLKRLSSKQYFIKKTMVLWDNLELNREALLHIHKKYFYLVIRAKKTKEILHTFSSEQIRGRNLLPFAIQDLKNIVSKTDICMRLVLVLKRNNSSEYNEAYILPQLEGGMETPVEARSPSVKSPACSDSDILSVSSMEEISNEETDLIPFISGEIYRAILSKNSEKLYSIVNNLKKISLREYLKIILNTDKSLSSLLLEIAIHQNAPFQTALLFLQPSENLSLILSLAIEQQCSIDIIQGLIKEGALVDRLHVRLAIKKGLAAETISFLKLKRPPVTPHRSRDSSEHGFNTENEELHYLLPLRKKLEDILLESSLSIEDPLVDVLIPSLPLTTTQKLFNKGYKPSPKVLALPHIYADPSLIELIFQTGVKLNSRLLVHFIKTLPLSTIKLLFEHGIKPSRYLVEKISSLKNYLSPDDSFLFAQNDPVEKDFESPLHSDKEISPSSFDLPLFGLTANDPVEKGFEGPIHLNEEASSFFNLPLFELTTADELALCVLARYCRDEKIWAHLELLGLCPCEEVLNLAVKYNTENVIALLLKNGVEPTEDTLHYLKLRPSQSAFLSLLVDRIDMDRLPAEKCTSSLSDLLVEKGSLEKLLKESERLENEKIVPTESNLIYAILRNSPYIVERLLMAGALVTELCLKTALITRSLLVQDLLAQYYAGTPIEDVEEITAEDIKKLATFYTHRHHIDFSGCILLDDDALESVLQNCPQVEFLYLFNCPLLTDRSLGVIGKYCQNIKELNIGAFQPPGDEYSYREENSQEEEAQSHFTDRGLQELVSCEKLEKLFLEHCVKLTDEALSLFDKKICKLHYLDLTDCPKISQKALDTLRERHPELQIRTE